jgi:hypothetical protein
MTAPPYVFIGGLHRSGTSLVHRLLRADPRVQGMAATGVWEDEGQHLQTVLPPARALGGPGRFGWHPEAAWDESRASLRMAESLRAAWGPWLASPGPTAVEKSPPNLLRFRLLQTLFPGAASLAIVRHPAAVALSTRRLRPGLRWASVPGLIEHWLHCHQLYAADRPRLERVVEVRYEALIEHPSAALMALGDELDLPGLGGGAQVSTQPSERAREGWRRWLKRAGRRDRRRLEAAAPGVARLGYDLLAGP